MLNDLSQWRIEELRAKERAEAKRWFRVAQRTISIRCSDERLIEVLDEHAPEIAKVLSRPGGNEDLSEILQRGAREIAEREIPPVSLQDIADELVGEVSNEAD